MLKVTTHEAKTQLSRLIAKVREGEEVLICRGDQPAARLVSARESEPSAPARPPVGTITSAPIHVSDDAFEPMDDETLHQWGLL